MTQANGSGVAIPKILHFTWKTEDVPGKMGEYLTLWRETHKDWDIRLWTDATMREFVAAHYPEFLATYDGYPAPIQRADSFRYLVLNIMGGVYSDLDVEPFRAINAMVEGVDCFVGLEPYEHIGPDRRHCGTPYLLSNAFMGAVPGHAYFRLIVDLLPTVADNPDIFYSTGPSLTTGAGVRLGRDERPKLVPPCLWSPHCDGGKPCTSDDKLADDMGADFDFIWSDRQAYVSHHWLTSWVPFLKRHKWLAKPFHAMHALKWAVRARLYPQLVAVRIPDPLRPYSDQRPQPLAEVPDVAICVALQEGNVSPALVAALDGLEYDKGRIRVTVGSFAQTAAEQDAVRASVKGLSDLGFAQVKLHFVAAPGDNTTAMKKLLPESRAMVRSAAMRNALADAVGAQADWVLFVGGEVNAIPADALRQGLEAGYPVVGLGMLDASGREVDLSTHRYNWGGGIRVTYKIRGQDGVASAGRGQRDFLSGQRAFRLVPLDGVGRGFVLVHCDVLRADIHFAEQPYHLHLDGEGFALMARHNGFEVAGLTGLFVTRA